MKRNISGVAGLLLALSLLPTNRPAAAQTLEMLVDLAGEWEFEVGDDPLWSGERFDDSRWDRIKVPGQWEDQGFPGYDGFAWARRSFKAPGKPSSDAFVLRIGNVDDIDEVFINGILIGYTGELPPHYATGYGNQRNYTVPPGLIRWGDENVIAVRIFDGEMGGGITNGPVGLYVDYNELRVQFRLVPSGSSRSGDARSALDEPVWRFRTGDKKEWSDPAFDDSDWKPVFVPMEWAAYGQRDYDGFGWYRVKFRTPDIDPAKSIILLVGKIDDCDETYLNGSRIGRTGKMPPHWARSNAFQELRAYTIPPGRMTAGAENVLAIRVYDGWLHGGINRGPIGFVTRESYVSWAKASKPKTTVLQRLKEFFSGDDSDYWPRPPED